MLLTNAHRGHRVPAPVTPLPPVGPPAALPDRPRVLPGREPLCRSADAVQFGLGRDRALVLDGLTPPLVRLVTGLDGARRVEEVLADAVTAGAGAGAALAVLGRLHAAGVLVGAAVPASHRPAVAVHGGGRVAVAVACVLAGSGACRVTVAAPGRVGADDVGTGLVAADVGRPRAAAIGDALARAAAPPSRRSGPAGPAGADLVVLADAPVADPAQLPDLGGPHLAVAVRDGIGVVGPLVLPGRTPCLRCDELARAEEDPAWPVVAAQLARRRPVVAPALASATAALAADQVLAALRGEAPAPPVLGAALELDPRTGSLLRLTRSWHPACGCAGTAAGAA